MEYVTDVLTTGVFSFSSDQPSTCQSSNIVDLINDAVSVSHAGYCLFYLLPRNTGQPAVPVRLLHPVARQRPASLLQLSSVAVRQNMDRLPVIDRLPVSADTRDLLTQHVLTAN